MLLTFLDEYLSEYFTDVLQQKRRENPDYDQALDKTLGASGRVSEIQDEDLKQWIESLYDVLFMEQSILYYQGLRDGAALLRKMGLF